MNKTQRTPATTCLWEMMEWLVWEGTSNMIQVQPPATGSDTTQRIRLARAPSSLALCTCRDGAATSPGHPVPHHPYSAEFPPNT